MTNALRNVCEQAVVEGKKVNLEDCSYGEPHWGEKFSDESHSYYCFLSGLVYSQRLTHILDLGTHCGGSVISMYNGIHKEDVENSRLVTVDTSYKNEDGLKKFSHIIRIQGDVLSRPVLNKVLKHFDRHVDLIFIDTDHKYDHVKTIINLYANRLRPKYIILDDVKLNKSMLKLWRELKAGFNDKVFDAAEIGIRSRNVGFGVIDWDRIYKPISWLEGFRMMSYLFIRKIRKMFICIFRTYEMSEK